MDEARITELWNRAVADTGDVLYPKIIARFAELIAAEERDACAKLAMDVPTRIDGMFSDDCKATAWNCAAAIRMRSNLEVRG